MLRKIKNFMEDHLLLVTLAIVAVAVIISVSVWTQTESYSRFSKSVQSDFDGGLDRVVTLYDYNGNPIKEWNGKIDVQENDTKVFFDLEGKRVVIYNGIVVTEEK